ncbi:unnamed protein product [Blepharisma stoltei]|uniref:Cyclin-like domain-containing protein n=1 Tax=Blepharisma stoltei TaxID=1481888 RepID=A0AAU9IKA8_9CILI|nr:unnamed protein product [Blepharisma stoltei]
MHKSHSKNHSSRSSAHKSTLAASNLYQNENNFKNPGSLHKESSNVMCQKMLIEPEIDLECHDTLDSVSADLDLAPPIWKPKDSEFLELIKEKQIMYMPNPYFMETSQPHINPLMRVVLFDWMMEVTSEFLMKRESVYLAMNYVDRLLSIVPNVKKDEYQLVGVAALYIASKLDEIYQPKISDFERAAANGYSVSSIKLMEKIILRHLGWKIMPVTTYNISNWLLSQWDLYITYHFGSQVYNNPNDFKNLPNDERNREQAKYEERFITYKQPNNLSYMRFRDAIHVLDAACLDQRTLKFSPAIIAATLVYLMTSKYFKTSKYALFLHNTIFQDQESFTHLEFDLACRAQQFIATFLASALEINNLEEIYFSAELLIQYIEIEFTYELPMICKVQSKERIEQHFEEFLTYQTHSPALKEFVENRMKNAK